MRKCLIWTRWDLFTNFRAFKQGVFLLAQGGWPTQTKAVHSFILSYQWYTSIINIAHPLASTITTSLAELFSIINPIGAIRTPDRIAHPTHPSAGSQKWSLQPLHHGRIGPYPSRSSRSAWHANEVQTDLDSELIVTKWASCASHLNTHCWWAASRIF
jgi:hypothetical protein